MEHSIPRSVIIKVTGPDSTHTRGDGRPLAVTENGTTSITTSGIVLKNNFIVTTATCLSPFFASSDDQSTYRLFNGTIIKTMMEEPVSDVRDTLWHPCSLVAVVDVQDVVQSLKNLVGYLGEWIVGWKVNNANDKAFRRTIHDLSKIVVLRLEGKSGTVVDSLRLRDTSTIQRGESVRIIGSPYGIVSSKLFMNVITSGIICNTLPTVSQEKTVLMTDARALPGMEGSMVLDIDNNIIGMLLPPICKLDDEYMEFNFIISMSAILKSLDDLPQFQLDRGSLGKITPNLQKDSSLFHIPKAEESLALLEIDSLWASGIVISSTGYIMTCAHLLRNYLPPKSTRTTPLVVRARISVRDMNNTSKSLWVDCSVNHITSYYSHMDVAILQITSQLENSLKLTPIPRYSGSLDSLLGSPVWVLGYAMFKPTSFLRATCTTGLLSRVVRHDNNVIILQSSAVVYSGNSGGLLLDGNGHLLGMVTCNIRQKDTAKTISRLNFSIPVTQLAPFLDYIDNGATDKRNLLQFDVPNKDVQALWQLQLQFEGEDKEEGTPPRQFGEKFSSYLKDLKIKSRL